jgi:HK97 gp10 family phage protein
MARLTIGDGLDTYISDLEKLAGPALEEDMRRTIYKGAAVVMDAVKDEAERLPTYGGYRRGTEGNKVDGVSKAQKSGILKGLGIAKMRYDGAFLNAKIGADGYNTVKTKRWPNGQPNAMIIRSLESGTSFMKKNPFVTRAVRKVRERAEKAMSDEYDKQVKKRLGGINNA